jgi:hypothetical protein
MKNRKLANLILIVFAFCLILIQRAYADEFNYDGEHFFFFMNGVPDLDQKRAASLDNTIKALPNDGNMYCVPTSAVNWMAYIANHGYPNLDPGPGNWNVSPPQFLNEYNTITGNIALMGFLMGTDPVNGTGSGENAMQFWLDAAAPGQFMTVNVYANGTFSPRARDASLMAIFGGLVNVGMGWYTNADQNKAHVRKGGHAVTLVAGNNVTDNFGGMGFNDPARTTDDNKLTQSPFTESNTAYEGQKQYYCYEDANGFPAGCVKRIQDRLSYTGSGYMDGYVAIIPKYGLSYTPSLDELILLTPIQLSSRSNPRIQKYKTPGGRKLVDLAINPISVEHPYLTEESDVVWKLDVLTGDSFQFAKVKKPRRLTYGGTKEDLYVLTEKKIFSINRDGKKKRKIKLSVPIDEIVFDEKNQRLIGLSRESNRVLLYDSSLEKVDDFPAPDGLLGVSGRLSASINPTTGEIFTLFEGARYFTRWQIGETREIRKTVVPLPSEITNEQGIYVDEMNNVFITGDDMIFQLTSEGTLDRRSPFFGLEAGSKLQISRPFTNFDPETMIGPSFYNVLPEDADQLTGNSSAIQ